VKIYVAAVEAPTKKERQHETQFTDNSDVLETYLKIYFQGPIPSLEVKTHYI
jgi:hypothetical protein